jgi:NADPH-dependent ferric siderophore reductase
MLKNTLLKWLTHPATITGVTDPCRDLRLLTLSSEVFRMRPPLAGDKLRVVVADGELRTYTPVDWNESAGTASLLAYRRSEGSASHWLSSMQPGASCQLLGPQRSTPLDKLLRPALFIGDETSIGLAHALQHTAGRTEDVGFLFEVSDVREMQHFLAAIDIKSARLVGRMADDSHLERLEHQLATLVSRSDPRQFVFSGRSSTIRYLSRSLKRLGKSPSQFMVKAFWIPGKRGLD